MNIRQSQNSHGKYSKRLRRYIDSLPGAWRGLSAAIVRRVFLELQVQGGSIRHEYAWIYRQTTDLAREAIARRSALPPVDAASATSLHAGAQRVSPWIQERFDRLHAYIPPVLYGLSLASHPFGVAPIEQLLPGPVDFCRRAWASIKARLSCEMEGDAGYFRTVELLASSVQRDVAEAAFLIDCLLHLQPHRPDGGRRSIDCEGFVAHPAYVRMRSTAPGLLYFVLAAVWAVQKASGAAGCEVLAEEVCRLNAAVDAAWAEPLGGPLFTSAAARADRDEVVRFLDEARPSPSSPAPIASDAGQDRRFDHTILLEAASILGEIGGIITGGLLRGVSESGPLSASDAEAMDVRLDGLHDKALAFGPWVHHQVSRFARRELRLRDGRLAELSLLPHKAADFFAALRDTAGISDAPVDCPEVTESHYPSV